MILWGGWPIFNEALEALRKRRMTMELSMTMALVAAVVIGETFTALIILLFVLIAEHLEGLTVERGQRALDDLRRWLPDQVVVLRDGREHSIATSELKLGEVVVVRPAERIPADGQVVAGHSFADEAAITGEPLAAEKVTGDRVFAGSINQAGVLEVRVDSLGSQTAFGRILEVVEQARHARAPVEKLADRLAARLVYFALACAAVTFLVTGDVRDTISVIIVAGACGVAAGTPLAILGALGGAARQGAIVKSGRFLEALGTIDTVVLDKTGTLTTGQARIRSVRAAQDLSSEEVLRIAAAAECRSEHPLARAVLEKARELQVSFAPPEDFSYTPGLGVACRVAGEEVLVGSRRLMESRGISSDGWRKGSQAATEILVGRAGRLLGVLEVEDPVRPEAGRALEALRGLGTRTILVTGDSLDVARAVASRLGIDELEAGMLPEDKKRLVEGLVAAGRRVAMVGDGINDAPALAVAHVGVAMGSGTDVTRECADVVLLGNDLERLVGTLVLARRCRRIIGFNFGGTIAVDLLGILLAGIGCLTPILAAFIHVSSELAFILNSARLLPRLRR
ncbi:MAG: cadmium-translocating P-type ATPase [Armatimonadetes bacterium]|nr:cadmium-translocating P-type ATPase [Armatimonadota bacterium]